MRRMAADEHASTALRNSGWSVTVPYGLATLPNRGGNSAGVGGQRYSTRPSDCSAPKNFSHAASSGLPSTSEMRSAIPDPGIAVPRRTGRPPECAANEVAALRARNSIASNSATETSRGRSPVLSVTSDGVGAESKAEADGTGVAGFGVFSVQSGAGSGITRGGRSPNAPSGPPEWPLGTGRDASGGTGSGGAGAGGSLPEHPMRRSKTSKRQRIEAPPSVEQSLRTVS